MIGKSKGFEISLDSAHHLLQVRAWGLWNSALMKKYENALSEKIEEIREDGRDWHGFIDLTGFSAQSKVIWNRMRGNLDTSGKLKIANMTYIERPEDAGGHQ